MTPCSECHGRASFQILPPKGFLCCWCERAVVVVRQIGDCAGAGYLLQMALQKVKKMVGIIDASVRTQHCTSSLLVKVCIQEM
jgi:hypothetical protein